MSDLTPLQQRRRRVFALLERKCDKNQPMLIDYHLDAFCREVLNLPVKPKDAEPYVGWIPLRGSSDSKVMRISENGVSLIKRFEGFRTKAYLCPANVWTIGYGHTKTTKAGMIVSSAKAEELLREDLKGFEKAVNQLTKVPLTQNQYDALVSFAFNIGVSAFGNSTLLKILNKGNYTQAAQQFFKWVNANGKKLPGLERRRLAEHDLFMS